MNMSVTLRLVSEKDHSRRLLGGRREGQDSVIEQEGLAFPQRVCVCFLITSVEYRLFLCMLLRLLGIGKLEP